MMDNLDSFQKLVSTQRTFLISIGLDCWDPHAYLNPNLRSPLFHLSTFLTLY